MARLTRSNKAGYEPIPATATADHPHLHRMDSSADRSRHRVVSWTLGTFLLLSIPVVVNRYDSSSSNSNNSLRYAVNPAVAQSQQQEQDSYYYGTDSNSNNNGLGNLRSGPRDSEEEKDDAEASMSEPASPSRHHDSKKDITGKKKDNDDDGKDDDVKERFYHHQMVDHFRDDNYSDESPEYWSNRYYQTTQHWKGPGYPIFVVIGGESATDDGFFYPFVTEHLAPHFGAAVLQIEHRFYGPYVPVENATTTQLLQLMTVEQALADVVRLTRHVRAHDLDCSDDRTSKHYCPVVTVGGSYPGALSALLRIVYPDFVDMAYAASAPLLMYAQSATVDPNVYYDIVTAAADRSSPGCAAAVKHALYETVAATQQATGLPEAAASVHVCADGIPDYIATKEMLADALVEIASFKFADDDMGAYPPGNHTSLYKTCQIFQTSDQPMKDFLFSLLPTDDDNEKAAAPPTCFDIRTQIPKYGTTLDDTDGDYHDGEMWDWQTCTDLIFVMGFSETSMFPPKRASYDHLTNHCRQRFGVTPRPYQLVEQWHFDDLTDHSYILFTNGQQDLWYGGSFTYNVSDTVLALNFPNGAHHSDLSHVGPSERDSLDIKAGFVQIQNILGTWLEEIKNKQGKHSK